MTEFRKFCIGGLLGSFIAIGACAYKGIDAYNAVYWAYHVGMFVLNGAVTVAVLGDGKR